MEIITSTTIKGLVAKGVYSPPGEYTVDAEHGASLIKAGIAKAKPVAVEAAPAAAVSEPVAELQADATGKGGEDGSQDEKPRGRRGGRKSE